MGDVDEHGSRFETPDELVATAGEPDLAEPVRGACEGVVDEMRQPDHPIAGSSEDVDVRDVAVEGLGTLDREQRRGDGRRRPSRGEISLKVTDSANEREPAAGCC